MISDDDLQAIKDRNPVDAVAGDMVRLRKRTGKFKHIGPCPICSDDSQSKDATRFECNADEWVCAVCQDRGDVIKLVMRAHHVDFRKAIDILGGVKAEAITPAIALKRGRAAYRRAEVKADDAPAVPDWCDSDALRDAYKAGWRAAAKAEAYARFARERERTRLWGFWRRAHWYDATVDRYLADRGLLVPVEADLKLADMQYFADGREDEPLLVHKGPAMLACDHQCALRQFRRPAYHLARSGRAEGQGANHRSRDRRDFAGEKGARLEGWRQFIDLGSGESTRGRHHDRRRRHRDDARRLYRPMRTPWARSVAHRISRRHRSRQPDGRRARKPCSIRLRKTPPAAPAASPAPSLISIRRRCRCRRTSPN
jgi:hypothetical protein